MGDFKEQKHSNQPPMPSWLARFTHLWLGLLAFTLIINIWPYLQASPAPPESGQVILETAHTSICSTHFWGAAGKDQSHDGVIQAATTTVSTSSSASSSLMGGPSWTGLTTTKTATFALYYQNTLLLRSFSKDHLARGPPLA